MSENRGADAPARSPVDETAFRADQALAALLIRKGELDRRLALRNPEADYSIAFGLPFQIVGTQRIEIEEHLRFVQSLIETLTDHARNNDASE